jgi:tetratricopeptide (TPR) repeat protein
LTAGWFYSFLSGHLLHLLEASYHIFALSGTVVLDTPASQQKGKDIFEQKTESILRCIDYSHSNLSPDAQQLLLCLAPFTSVFDTGVLNNYTDHLKQQSALTSLPFDRWPEVIREAQNWGLLSPDPDIPRFLRLQPTLTYFLRNRLHESGQAEMKQAVETAFREHYDQVGGMLNRLLRSKEPQEKQVGQLLTRLEYENLVTALNLALEAQVIAFYTHYITLFHYLKSIQAERRGLELGEFVVDRLNAYPSEKLTGSMGIALAGTIDTIATQQLNLKHYAAAEASFQKAIQVMQENMQYDSNDSMIKMNIARIYHRLGRVAQEQRQWTLAEQYYQQALQIKIEFNDRPEQADTYQQLGIVAAEQRQWTTAD